MGNSQCDINETYSALKHLTEKLKLKINKTKSKFIIFRNKKPLPISLINNISLEVVAQFNCLGNLLNYNLDDAVDVEAKLSKFYGSYNSVFRNFSNVDIEIFLYFCNSYCAPQYDLSLWHSIKYFH